MSLTCANGGRERKERGSRGLEEFCATFGRGKAVFWCSSEELEAKAAWERAPRASPVTSKVVAQGVWCENLTRFDDYSVTYGL